MSAQRYFNRDSFEFLRDLKENNNRDWFEANKARYETSVRQPFLDMIAALAPGIKQINPAIVVDPNPNKGSMMRIHRDIRFSKDKSPYKTFVAARFGRGKTAKEGSPALYLRIEPGGSVAGGGIWQPGTVALVKVRDRIAHDPKSWQRATSGLTLGRMRAFAGESLKRPPVGYDATHPFIEDIKRKDFAIGWSVTDAEVCGPGLKELLLERYRAVEPFLEFLSEATGLD